MSTVDEFLELCRPVSEWLEKYGDPHWTVVITKSFARLTIDEMGGPIEKAD